MGTNTVGLVADHHARGDRSQGGRGLQHMIDERPARHLVEDLRRGRAHPGALPGGEDDDVDGLHGCSFVFFWARRRLLRLIFRELVDLLRRHAKFPADLASDFSAGRRTN